MATLLRTWNSTPYMEYYISVFGYRLCRLRVLFGIVNTARRRASRALCASETCWPRLRRLDELCTPRPCNEHHPWCLSVSRLFWEAATCRRAGLWRRVRGGERPTS